MTQQTLFGQWEPQKLVNVASVPHRSPFRYPGGKTWLIPRIRTWLLSHPTKPTELIEPFAGGASVSLAAVFEDLVCRRNNSGAR
jgi:DNA adenine methylase